MKRLLALLIILAAQTAYAQPSPIPSYTTLQDSGTARVQRRIANFSGALTVADDSSNLRSNVTVASGGITNTMLANPSLTVATTSPLGGGGSVSLGGTLTLTCSSCLTGTPTAVGDLLYSTSGGQALSKLADVAVGSYLRSGGVATAPLWSTLKLPNAATTGDLAVATGTNTLGSLADVATGSVLVSGGVGSLPVWSTALPSGVLPNVGPGPGTFTWSTGDSVTLDAQGRTTAVTPVVRTLTGGTGINTIGTLAADRTISVDQTFSPTWTGTHTFTLSPVVGVGTGTTKSILFSNATGPGTLSWNPSAARTLTLPDVTDTIVARTTTDTLTNKTISGSSNTLSNIANGSLTNSAVTINAPSAVFAGSGAVSLGASLTLTLQTQTANTVWAGPTTGAATAPTFRALVAADIPSLSGTYLPLTGGVMSGAITLSGTQLGTYTLGGTPTLGANLAISTSATFHIGDTTHLLTNIATGRVIGGASNTNGHVVPNVADDTFDLIATAQTLTNKTISGSSNTLSSIANGSLVNSSLTIATTSPLGGGGAVSLGGTATALTCTTCLTGIPTAIGDVMYSTAGGQSFTALADVSAGSYLRSGGVASAPLWSTLKLPNGATTGDIMVATATNTVGSVADVAVNQVLLSGGVGVVPTWGTVPNAALANSSITVATTSPITGAGTWSLGSSQTIACPTCLTGSLTSGVLPVASGATALSNSNFTASGNVFDVASAGTLSVGTSVATALAIGKSGVTTTITGGLTQLTGAFSLTGNAQSQLTTTAGSLVLDSASGGLVDIGVTTTSGIAVGRSGVTTTITGALTQLTGAFSLTGNGSSSLATTSGALTITSAAAATWSIATAPVDTVGALLRVNGGTGGTYSASAAGIGGNLLATGGQGGSGDATHTGATGGVGQISGGAGGLNIGGGGGNGGNGNVIGGTGSVANAASVGGNGGTGILGGGSGGAGSATGLSGAGGPFAVVGGAAGVDNGGGRANGGSGTIRGGAGTTNGSITIGDINTAAVNIGSSAITTTVTGGLTQLTGAISLTANAASSITTSSGALTLTSAAGATWTNSSGTLAIATVNATASSLQLDSTSNNVVIGGTTAAGVQIGRVGTLITLPGGIIRALTPAAGGGVGVAMQFGPANGGAANGVGFPAGIGGGTQVAAGNGGNGDASNAPAAGATLLLTSGIPGTVGAFGGGANSGDINMNIPAPSGTGTSGIYRWEFAGNTSPGMALTTTQLSIAEDNIVYGRGGSSTVSFLQAVQGTANTAGGALLMTPAQGGASNGSGPGGTGGGGTWRASQGGPGSGAQNPGNGGVANFLGGPGGTGGTGNSSGGNVVIDGGTPQGTGTGGLVLIGNGAATSSITIGHSGMPSGITLTTGGGGLAIQGATASGTIAITQSASSGTVVPAFTVNSGAHTNLTATTEFPDANFNFARTETWAAGNITTQRAMVARAPTYAFAGASTITNAATLAITGAPAAGTNATLTHTYALWAQAGLARFDGGIQFSDGTTQTTAAAGGASTLAIAYTNGTSSADQLISLSAGNGGGVVIQDAGSTVGTLLDITNNGASLDYFRVSSTNLLFGRPVLATTDLGVDIGNGATGGRFNNIAAQVFTSGNFTPGNDVGGTSMTIIAQSGGPASSLGGGAGGGITLVAGQAGNGTSSLIGGTAGAVFIESGGGAAAGSSSASTAGGLIELFAALGGAGSGSNPGASGGPIVLNGGTGGPGGGSSAGGVGGGVQISGGTGGNFGTAPGIGGAVSLLAGPAGGTGASTASSGGGIAISTGVGSSSATTVPPGSSGSVNIQIPDSPAVTVNATGSGPTGASGGSISITAGKGSSLPGGSSNALTSGVGGVMTISSGGGGDGSGGWAGNTGGLMTVTAGTGGANINGTAAGVGGELLLVGGTGGLTSFNTTIAGAGGITVVSGGTGGPGSSTGAPGAGGALQVVGGSGGVSGGVGSANGGNISVDGGSKTNAGTNGTVSIGASSAASIAIGHSGITTTITGTTTHVGALTQSGGTFTIAGNGASTISTSFGTLNITSAAGSGATWSTGDGGVLAAAFDRTSGGTMQLGITTATAIQVAQSGVKTTFNGPVNVVSQAAPGSPANGDVWTDSTRNSLTTRQNGLTQQLEGTMFSSTATATVNTATTATLVGTGIGTTTLPANFCAVGKTVHLHVGGIMTTSASAGNWTWLIKLGATTVATTGALASIGNSLTTKGWGVDAYIVFRTCGASGTVMVDGGVTYANGTTTRGYGELNNAGATTTLSTTSTLAVDTQVTLGSSGQTITGTYTNIEIMN